MTTFSPARDSHSKSQQPSVELDQFKKGLADLGRRLLNLLTKTGCPTNSYEGQEWSIPLLKDFVYDIDEKIQ